MKKNIFITLVSLLSLYGFSQVPTASFTASNVRCIGVPISLTDASTNAPTSWTWNLTGGTPSSSNIQFPNVTYSTPGNYTIGLVATNGMGSSTLYNIIITVSPNPTISVASHTACNGDNVSFSASGATSYTWLPSNSNGSVFNTIASSSTIFTVNGTSSFGCNGTNTANLIVYANPAVSVTTGSLCFGQNLVLTASGATTYTWSTGVNTQSISVSPGVGNPVFNVVGTDINGCKDVAAATVSVFPLPPVSATSGTTCPNQGLSIFAGGATTYTWASSPTLFPHDSNNNEAVVYPTSPTTYTVYGADNNGCVNSGTTIVYTSLPPNFSLTTATVCPNITATLVATAISPISSFFWSNGTNSLETAANATATTIYTCTANTDNGCSSVKTTTLYVYPSPVLGSASGTVCAGKPFTINASGAVSYTWSTGSNNASIVVTPTITTSYLFSGESANGCIGSSVVSVTVVPLPNVFIAPKSVCLGKSVTLSALGGGNYTWSTNATTQTISVAPTTNTTYTCIGMALTGCSNTAVTTVTVFPTPTVTITAPSICAGQTATVTAAAANTYSWSTGNNGSSIYVVPNTTTSYTCIGLSVNNCEYTSTTVVNVTSVATPAISQNGAILTSSSPTGNQWYLNGAIVPGATGQTYITSQNGNYSLIVTVGSCSSSSVNKTILDTGLEDFDLKSNLVLFPNPTSGDVSITLANTEDAITVKVYNSTGQFIKTVSVTNENNVVDLQNETSGIYLLEFSLKQHKAFLKVIKL